MLNNKYKVPSTGRGAPAKDNAMGDSACPECGKSGDACKCAPGANKTGTTSKTKEDANAPIKPGKKRTGKEIGAYLRNKAKNKGMLSESDPSGDEV